MIQYFYNEKEITNATKQTQNCKNTIRNKRKDRSRKEDCFPTKKKDRRRKEDRFLTLVINIDPCLNEALTLLFHLIT